MQRLAVLLSVLIALSVAGSTERVLIPIKALGVPGANGSVWRSTLAVTNHSDRPIHVSGLETCPVSTCDPSILPPHGTFFTGLYPLLLSVDALDVDDLGFQLRVQDVSRQLETWGTSIPTVKERDGLVAPRIGRMTDIPMTAEFRSMLRVYDFDPIGFGPPRQVLVRYFAIDPSRPSPGTSGDPLIHEAVYTLFADSVQPLVSPPMASIPLWTIDELDGHERIRVEVSSRSPDLRFWAFVSVTNNATQHVTVIGAE